MALIALLLRTLTGEEAPAKDADDAGPLRPSEVGVLREVGRLHRGRCWVATGGPLGPFPIGRKLG